MIKKESVRTSLLSLVFTVFSVLFSACTAGNSSIITGQAAIEPKEDSAGPRLVVSPYQEAVYNGAPQPLSYRYNGETKPVIIYYPSPEARKEGRNGNMEAPVNAGIYYVRVQRYPGRNEHFPVEEFFAEYRILKCPVKINVKENQEAIYNGDPKRVQASADPPVLLMYSYYPKKELREIAQRNLAEDAASRRNSSRLSAMLPAGTFSGYKRVERAPIEQGTYYVWIYFPGDENHEAAHLDLEFTILPPLNR